MAECVAQTGLQIAAFGYAIKPDPERNKAAIKAINQMESEMSTVGNGSGLYGPAYRSGGLWGLFTNRGIALGRNLVIPEKDNIEYQNYTFVHETAHYYQQIYSGYTTVLSSGMYEQWFMSNPYSTPGTQEWIADQLYLLYYYR